MNTKEMDALTDYMDAIEEAVFALKKQVAEAPRYEGVWQRSAEYTRGAMVTDQGTLWHCVKATTDRPGESQDWQMMVKTGQAT